MINIQKNLNIDPKRFKLINKHTSNDLKKRFFLTSHHYFNEETVLYSSIRIKQLLKKYKDNNKFIKNYSHFNSILSISSVK